MKQIILIFLFTLSFKNSFSIDTFNWGLQGGSGIVFWNSPQFSYQVNSKVRNSIGFFSEYNLNRVRSILSIYPKPISPQLIKIKVEFFYQSNGYCGISYYDETAKKYSEDIISFHYLSLSVLAKYNFIGSVQMSCNKVRCQVAYKGLYIFAGPKINYLLQNFNSDNDQIEKLLFGFKGGLGYKFLKLFDIGFFYNPTFNKNFKLQNQGWEIDTSFTF